jgi:hypothetical protein
MGSSWNSDVHWRQARADDGAVPQEGILHAAFEGDGAGTDSLMAGSWRRWRPLLAMLGLLLLGVALVLYSPLPGLGLVLVLGVSIGAPVTVMMIWLAP